MRRSGAGLLRKGRQAILQRFGLLEAAAGCHSVPRIEGLMRLLLCARTLAIASPLFRSVGGTMHEKLKPLSWRDRPNKIRPLRFSKPASEGGDRPVPGARGDGGGSHRQIDRRAQDGAAARLGDADRCRDPEGTPSNHPKSNGGPVIGSSEEYQRADWETISVAGPHASMTIQQAIPLIAAAAGLLCFLASLRTRAPRRCTPEILFCGGRARFPEPMWSGGSP